MALIKMVCNKCENILVGAKILIVPTKNLRYATGGAILVERDVLGEIITGGVAQLLIDMSRVIGAQSGR